MSSASEKQKHFLGLDIEKRSTPLIVFGVVVLLWCFCWIFITVYFKGDSNESAWSSRGQFGDMFGAINALFTGLAFAGLILTILLQREELRAQKKELRLNTNALTAQKNEMNAQWRELEKQNSNLKRQRFETTFFNMWNIHFKTRDLITVNNHNGILAFAYFVKEATKIASKNEIQGEVKLSSIVNAAVLVSNSTGFFPMSEIYVGSLKLIHSYVIDAKLNEKAKDRYLNFMKAYLSNGEVEFMVYLINQLKIVNQESELLPLYYDLKLNENFAYRFEQRWKLKLIADKGIL